MSCGKKKSCEIKRLQNGKYYTPTVYSAQELYTRFSQCIVFIETDFELNTPNNPSQIYTTQCTGFFLDDFLVAPASSMYLPSIPSALNIHENNQDTMDNNIMDNNTMDNIDEDIPMAIESSEYPVAIRVYLRNPKYPSPISAQIVALDAKSNIALLVLNDIDIHCLKQFKMYKSQPESIYNTSELIMYYYVNPNGSLEILKTSIPKSGTSRIDLNHPLITFTDLESVPPHSWNTGTPIFNIYGWITGMFDPTLRPQGGIDRQCFYTLFCKLRQGYLSTGIMYLNIWSYLGLAFNVFESTTDYLAIDESVNPEIPAPNRLYSLQNQEKLTCINALNIPGLFLFNTPPETFAGVNERFAIELERIPESQSTFGWSLDRIYYGTQTLRQLYLSLNPSVGPYLDSQVNLSRFA